MLECYVSKVTQCVEIEGKSCYNFVVTVPYTGTNVIKINRYWYHPISNFSNIA